MFSYPSRRYRLKKSIRRFKSFLSEVSAEERLKITGFYVVAFKGNHPHIHALLSGLAKKSGKTLLDVNHKYWELSWPVSKKPWMNDSLKIEIPENMIAVSRYVAENMTRFKSDKCDYGFL